jgi:hypothetical protein
MPSNALLPIEFLMGVVAEEKLITINWAAYGGDVNTVQRSQYFQAIADLTRNRDELLAKSHQGLGLDSLVKVPAFGSTRPESGVFSVEEFPYQPWTMSTPWERKLAMEVSEFLEVASIEWWSTKHMVERTTAEKKELVEKARGEMHFRNSNTCAFWACTTNAAPEWVKSFGFREFDGNMAAKEIEDGCEDARKSNLQELKDHAIATCQSIGRSAELLDFITTLGKLFP